MINADLFAADDYESVQEQYFGDLRAEGRVDSDPSGWLRTRSNAEDFVVFPQITSHDFARYYLDEGNSLGRHKENLAAVLSRWEGYPVDENQFTLCPSGTCSALVTFGALKALGVKRIVIETPAYFGVIEQASLLELQVELLPTYRHDGYALPRFDRSLHGSEPIVVWLTQPRASLGFNQSIEAVREILERLKPGDYLVIDEVTDQSYPSHLGSLRIGLGSAKLIRIRSFTKAMGLNGFRLSAVLHPSSLRSALTECLETFGGSLDAHSLFAADAFCEDPARLQMMLGAANSQVIELREKAEMLTRGSAITINPLVNGYIGSMVADLSHMGQTELERRESLLKGCRSVRTPVVLGASFYMAKDPPTEAIRLNFFTQRDHMLRGIANVSRVVEPH